MEKIKIDFLGTSGSIPTKKKNHTGILISYKDQTILFDCGEGTQRQFKLSGISPAKLNKIFITHWHGDHVLGLPGLLQTLSALEYNKTLEIYGPRGIKSDIENLKKTFPGSYPSMKVIELESKKLEFEETEINFTKIDHGVSGLAYSIKIKDKLRLDKSKLKKLKIASPKDLKALASGKDIKLNKKTIKSKDVSYIEKGKKITIILDTLLSKSLIKLAKCSDLIISEATFSKEEKEIAKKYMHLTAEDAAKIAKSSDSTALILTHISERYSTSLNNIETEAKSIFKNTRIAKDFDSVVL